MKRLIEIQNELKAPKNQYNSFGKYKYRSCEDIMEGVKPLLKAKGLALIMHDDLELIGDRYYIRAIATIFDGEGKKIVESSAYAREEENKKGMDSSQVTGATSSYARKYALNGLFAIDDTKDSDATNTHGKEEKKQAEPLIDKDYDILSQIQDKNTLPLLEKYYNEQKVNVKDLKRFNAEITKQKKKLEAK